MTESDKYLKEQIITYLGNKRGLLGEINNCIVDVKKKLDKEKLVSLDLFSGSGVVSRLLKQHSSLVIANDLEKYSEIVNECYLSNRSEIKHNEYKEYKHFIEEYIDNNKFLGIISNNYAPKNDEKIKKGERVFYTSENARRIDTYRKGIQEIPNEMQKFFLAPLLYESSVHVNTSGVFKGFYKDSVTGIGKYGGNGGNALKRILGRIQIKEPVWSYYDCEYRVMREDANSVVNLLGEVDVAYLDPPYNQHPYGSNYFMLNVIANNKIDGRLSRVSGIPDNWNRSVYNKSNLAINAFDELLGNVKSKYIIISYNSEGFIPIEKMKEIVNKYGKATYKAIKYNTFRGCRNLNGRSTYVHEFLITLRKDR